MTFKVKTLMRNINLRKFVQRDIAWIIFSHAKYCVYYPVSKILAECKQISSRFDQKISTD